MTVVVAVPDLSHIPQGIVMWIRSIAHDIELKVLSWLEETIPVFPPTDPTPKDNYFAKVLQDNSRAQTIHPADASGKAIITIEFDTLLAICKNLEHGSKRDELEATLHASPYFREEFLAPVVEPRACFDHQLANPIADQLREAKGKFIADPQEGSSSVRIGGDSIPTERTFGSEARKVQGTTHASFNSPELVRTMDGTSNRCIQLQNSNLDLNLNSLGPAQFNIQPPPVFSLVG